MFVSLIVISFQGLITKGKSERKIVMMKQLELLLIVSFLVVR